MKNCTETDMKKEEIQQDEPKDHFIQIEIPNNIFEYLSSENSSINNICRICMSTNNGDMISLYSEEIQLSDMFSSITSLQISPEDGLPPNICEACRTQVVTSHEFKIRCIQTDSALKTLLSGEFLTKDEIETKHDIEAEEVKAEDLIEDIEYLEEIDDFSDDEAPCTKQDSEESGKKETKKSETKTDKILKLLNSVKKPTKRQSYVCNVCSKKFNKLKNLRLHMRKSHKEQTDQPYCCDQCYEPFSNDHDMQLHKQLHSDGPLWKCMECKKEYRGRAHLRRHIQRHMQCKRYSCVTCNKSFAELYALRRHERVHTGVVLEKRHACHLCDKRYTEKSQLTAHLARHSGARPCICAVCGKDFPSPRLLASHNLVHTDRKVHACLYCDKRFRHESTRNTHHRTHTGEKPYVCALCGKTFIQNSNLTLHMRTHTGERPYKCAECNRSFSSGSSLKNHQRSHTGEKPYGCHICGKKFSRIDLSGHMRQHTGERPFACSVCPKRFAAAARLRDHARTHTGEKPYECASCPQKFVTKGYLARHMKVHEKANKKRKNRPDKPLNMVIVREVDCEPTYVVADEYVITKENGQEKEGSDTPVDVGQEVPLEVTEELILPDEDVKEMLIVDDSRCSNFENGAICLTSGVNFVNNELNYANDMNLVTVNEGEVSISASSAVLEGTTVKLYQLDQSLVQIHSSGGQVTISKITSKMTANF